MFSDSLFNVSSEKKQKIRKCYDLDKPGKMDEAVAMLEDWIQKQNHFNKKDFKRNFLEMTIIQCKGSLERAKTRLDKYCTLRTMLPKFFDKTNVKTDFPDIHSADMFALPKLTEDYSRVFVVKPHKKINNGTNALFLEFYKFLVINGWSGKTKEGETCRPTVQNKIPRSVTFTANTAEYQKAHDYSNGVVIIFDYLDINVGDFVAGVNPIDLGEAMRIFTECYGLRLRGFHFITPSKMVQVLVVMMKQILSQKLGDRIHVHKNVETLYEYVPRESFPLDYGGDEKSVAAVKAEWMDLLASEEHIKYMQEMRGATSDEKYRDTYEFNTKYMGLPGTFRSLVVD